MIKVNEVFNSIQGEGTYQGKPALFIRLSGCTRKCSYCDSSYHVQGERFTVSKLVDLIRKSPSCLVVWTGGEPLLQLESIKKVIEETSLYLHCLETNGDLVSSELYLEDIKRLFFYTCISPKSLVVAKRCKRWMERSGGSKVDIKVVTDSKFVNVKLILYATILMPLTTYNEEKDSIIRKRVWEYCVSKNIPFSCRLQTMIWGKQRRV